MDKRMKVVAVDVHSPDGVAIERVADPAGLTAALAAHWAPTFARKPIEKAAPRWLLACATDFGFAEVRAPSAEDFGRMLDRAAPAAPSPEGLSFAHWRAAGPSALSTMQEAFFWISGSGRFGVTLNRTLANGQKDDDQPGPAAKAGASRPITLKDTLNKCVCGVGNFILKKKVPWRAATVQLGFIYSRSLLQNVLDIYEGGHDDAGAGVGGSRI